MKQRNDQTYTEKGQHEYICPLDSIVAIQAALEPLGLTVEGFESGRISDKDIVTIYLGKMKKR